MEIDRDFLCSLDPIFRLNSVKIYWADNVFKVGNTNSLQPRILIIASPGIYLIRKKSFAFQSRVINSISFCDLVSLYVAGQCVSFSSNQTQIRVKHRKITDVAFLAFFIRQAQFPTDVLPLNITFADENVAVKITPEQSPYQPASLFLDRMLSCIKHYNLMVTNTLFSYFPPPNSRVFTITDELLSSSLFQAWILSLAYEQEVDTLQFKSVQLSKVLSRCNYLIRYNRFIKVVHFIDVDFEDSASVLNQMLSKAHGFKPVKWIFEKCDLSKPSFNQFFDATSNIGKSITHIQIIDCTFSNESFPALFQSIFFNDCFHSLNQLVIDHTNAENILLHVSEILCCSWAMELKCFHQLSIVKSDSDDCSPFLSQLLKFDVGIQYINLSENSFIKPLDVQKSSTGADFPCELTFLGLSKCKMSLEFLLSLIQLIRDSKLFVHGLDLSELSLSNEEFNHFLNSISTLKIDNLETLIFDKNRMNSNQTLLFTNFLKLHPSIKHLSLNRSFDIRESPNGLLSFINYATKLNLISLSMRGDQSMERSFGMLLNPLLQSLQHIQSLDITDQKVGQAGLEILLPLINSGQLTELHFDGSKVKDYAFLCQFCSTLLSSKKLTYASFPLNDFNQRLIELLPSTSSDNFESSIETLMQNFKTRFHHPKTVLNTLKSITLTNSLTKSMSYIKPNSTRPRMVRTDSFMQMPTDNMGSMMMKPDIEKLYKECVENDGETEPIVLLVNTIENSYTFDSLFAGLSSTSEKVA
ncbi:hypothetical protein TRFO_33718 [Tritrichomonas foetus]|uniref:Leucine Rich Repeat family protein n=1 Tax=Tritrichomonas foetus TaxID=1144522 RepID=A0A1J4JM74_9EUKA|nr:hypothetical protein TRFO_33718 [Tritrichomonas foetus]|eukprot:OHS99793.1 hypothetical protein TRFO_33718 [Tritrichomonas foetus]